MSNGCTGRESRSADKPGGGGRIGDEQVGRFDSASIARCAAIPIVSPEFWRILVMTGGSSGMFSINVFEHVIL